MSTFLRMLMPIMIVATTMLAFAKPAMTRVILNERTTYYNVQGQTGREIFQSMIRNGPKIGRGVKNHALATTEYDYDVKNVDFVIQNGRCVPRKLDLHLTVTYTYPRWNGHSRARASTRKAWRSFFSAVTWHEKQHVKIAMEYAEEYVQVLKKARLRAGNNCNAEGFSSHWRANRAALKHNRKQRQFDRQDLRRGGRGYEAQLRLIQAE